MVTKDYSKFKNIDGNRKITPAHVEKLVAAMERRNLLEYFPVLVNEKMEVIDGQHRLIAAAKLDYPVTYEVVPGLELEDVMSINTNSKGWSTMDFIDTYIKLGNPYYEQLKKFIKRTGFGVSLSAQLLQGKASSLTGGSHTSQLIRAGEFKVVAESFAERIAEYVRLLSPNTDFDSHKDRGFVKAIVMLDGNEGFDMERLVSKLRMHGLKLQRRPDAKYYLIHIEELYNFNAKARVELYASTQAKGA